jgi:hypothetical protein
MEELISLALLLTLALETVVEWLSELDYLFKMLNLCNFIQLESMEQDV